MTEPVLPDPPLELDEPAPPSGGAGRLVRSSAAVAAGTALSRATGFLRVSALAAIGFARLSDVYNIANSTPNIVYELLLGGILSATLVPLYVEHVQHRDEESTDAINTAAIVALLVITVLGTIAAPWIVKLYTLRLEGPGKAAQQELATDLLRLFMPQVFFYGLTALMTAMLNARRRFAAAAFAPALNNVIVIGVLLALPRLVDGRVTVPRVLHDPPLVVLLGLGTTAGIVAMTLVLLPALKAAGARFHWHWDLRHPAVLHLARLSSWTVGYVIANQVAFWAVLVLSYRSSGDTSVYLAAFTFFQLPHGLFTVSIMTVIAPELASRASAGDLPGLRHQFASGLRLMGLVVIPATAFLTVLARPAVNALLDYGDFSARSAVTTGETLALFAIGLFTFSAYLFTLRAFYALQDTRTPFWVNLVENAVNIALAIALYPALGVQGLALAWTVAYVVGAALALGALHRRLGSIEGARTVGSLGRVALATAPAALVAWLIATTLGYATAPAAIVALAVGGTAGLVVLVGALALLRVPELAMLGDALRRRRGARAAGV